MTENCKFWIIILLWLIVAILVYAAIVFLCYQWQVDTGANRDGPLSGIIIGSLFWFCPFVFFWLFILVLVLHELGFPCEEMRRHWRERKCSRCGKETKHYIIHTHVETEVVPGTSVELQEILIDKGSWSEVVCFECEAK